MRKIPAKIVEENGVYRPEITAWNKKNLQNLMSTFVGKDVFISIERPTKNRSTKQNNYLWGVPYKIISDHTGDDPKSIHHHCKTQFLSEPGNAVNKVKSTTKLNTTEFIKYVQDIIDWACPFFGVYIPLPNEKEMWSMVLDEPRR